MLIWCTRNMSYYQRESCW